MILHEKCMILSDFDAHSYTGKMFFFPYFSYFFFDVKIVRDDSGLHPTDSDFGTDFFPKQHEVSKGLVNR